MQLQQRSDTVKKLALQCGFSFCGIAKAEQLEQDAYRLEKWLNKNRHGAMAYMENHFDKRIDPRKLVPGAKSVITLLYNYYPQQVHATDGPKISKYAYGNDYHVVVKEKLKELVELIKQQIGDIEGRAFVDSAPLLERSWAVKSGLGWVGKNGNLITKGHGSFFFIATLVVDAEFSYDNPFVKDYCGTCTACIDSCPTQAILPNKEIDGSRCISYYTIELKDSVIPSELSGTFDNWMFGCDTCQDVCPWNRFSKPHTESKFEALAPILNLKSWEWEQMSEENFNNTFKHSPLKRSKWQGIQRNLKFIKKAN